MTKFVKTDYLALDYIYNMTYSIYPCDIYIDPYLTDNNRVYFSLVLYSWIKINSHFDGTLNMNGQRCTSKWTMTDISSETLGSFSVFCYEKKSLNSDGQQFHQY